MKFGIIGDGYVSRFHKAAIIANGGSIGWIHDPDKGKREIREADVIVVASPSYLHSEHTRLALGLARQVIVEKPLCMPWEPIIDDDRVNIVMQYRWADLPVNADRVYVEMVRNENYYKGWKGNFKYTGGALFNLFIHYIDLAARLGAGFVGVLKSEGAQVRKVDDIDLMKIDTEKLYIKMYRDILNGKGIKPKDVYYLHWLLNKYIGEDAFANYRNRTIRMGKNF